jgi:ABC-type uncharacterized transport system involved in gliding motility auxiliary subunit
MSQSMTKRKTRYRASYLLMILVVIAVLAVVNVLGAVRFKRLDLTEDKMFTVSPALRRILRGLPDVVKVTYYVSRDLPEEVRGVRRETLDRFQDLERASGGNFQYRIVDVPREIFDDEKRESDAGLRRLFEELESEGIPPVNLGVQRTAGAEQALIYSTITVAYLDKSKEIIHPYEQPLGLEYELAMLVVRLTQESKPVVAFFDGKPKVREIPSRSPFMPARRVHEFTPLVGMMGQFFDVREIRLTEESPIPDETACLIVVQPSSLNERQKYEINRYVSGGGNAIFFVSQYEVDTASGRVPFPVAPNTPMLADVFETWGFRIGPDLVADMRTSIEITIWDPSGGVMRGRRQWMPIYLVLTGEYLEQRSPLTARLGALFFRNATPIELNTKRLEANGIKAETLAETSAESWFLPVAGAPFLSPFFNKPKIDEFKGPQKLAVLFRGTFPFTYAGRQVPAWPAPPAPVIGPEGPVIGPGGPEPPFSVMPPPGEAPSESSGPETHPALTGDEAAADEEAPVEETPADEVVADEVVADEAEVGGPGEGEGVEPATEEAGPRAEAPVIAPPLELKPATVLVVSTVELIKIRDDDLRGNPALTENRLRFFNNAVETLARGRDLVSIRAKMLTMRPFEHGSKARMTAYTLINLLAVPVLVIALGVVRYVMRRRSRRVYREKGLS